MILAAGLGTRLRPLTDVRPKPLVPVANRPVIDRMISYLKGQGVTRIAVNTHHHALQMAAFLRDGVPFGLPVRVYHEPDILGTAGGLRNAADFWGEDTLIVINGDILTDMDLAPVLNTHHTNRALVTLVLHACPPFNQILLDQKKAICDISTEPGPGRVAFTGIHIVEPGLREYIPPSGFADIVPIYRRMILDGNPPAGHLVSGHSWRDMGTIESYLSANRECATEPFLVGEGCSLDPSVHFHEWAVTGPGCRLERGVRISRSVLWEGVVVREGVRVTDSVVTSHRIIDRDLMGEAL